MLVRIMSEILEPIFLSEFQSFRKHFRHLEVILWHGGRKGPIEGEVLSGIHGEPAPGEPMDREILGQQPVSDSVGLTWELDF